MSASIVGCSVRGVAFAAVIGLLTWPATASATTTPGDLCPQPVAQSLSSIGLQPASGTLEPWSQRQLDPARVWPLTTGRGVTVAVIDSGVDARNPALAGAVEPGADVVQPGQPANYDCVGHGTAVAGIIAARPRPGSAFEGIAPGARILPVRQTESDQQEGGGVGFLATAIDYAVSHGAEVINVSITATSSTPVLAAAVRNALDHDVVIVAAAGNDGASVNAPKSYPAAFPGVLAVGAAGQDGQPLDFSAAGASVVAPGADIIGPEAGGTGLVTGQGTSFATAFVSGVVALVRAYRPDLTAAQVVQRIEATADHPPGPLPDPRLGWGEIDPYAAVTAVLAPQSAPSSPAARLPLPPRPGPAPSQLAAILTAAAALASTLVILGIALLLPAGRRRRWQPGSWRNTPGSAGHLDAPRRPAAAVQDAATGGQPGGRHRAEQGTLVRAAGQHNPGGP
jgi:membrane-anchored mycosin MYCP